MNDQQSVIVRTNSGSIEGGMTDGLCIFKGIPFAEAPVGDLRWLPPRPVKPWEGIRSAKAFGTIAIQPEPAEPPPGMVQAEPEPQSEDCLFLNIYTPAPDAAGRPVMFWIHGGAFTMGSGSSPMFDGTGLVKKGDIVFVSCNYRLGQLGFLRLKEITNGKIPATGNEGLFDQIMALQWVRDNIAAFGGDPGNVTVFGESAGAMSIGCLLAMPAAKALFRKAILQSGVGNTAISREEAVENAGKLLQGIGIDGNDVDAVRNLTPQQILDADEILRQPSAPGEAVKLTISAPVIDGETLPDITNEMAKQGFSRDVLTVVGSNLDEYRLFAMMEPSDFIVDDAEMKRRLSEFIDDDAITVVVETYRKFLEKRGESTGNKDILSAIETDLMFRIPAVDFLEAQTRNGQDAYNYLFTWNNPNGGPLGACHALEMGFVFGALEPVFCGTGPDADRLSECIQDAWLSFARTGKPGGSVIGEWPPYGNERFTMLLDRQCRVETAPYDDVRKVWENVRIKKTPLP